MIPTASRLAPASSEAMQLTFRILPTLCLSIAAMASLMALVLVLAQPVVIRTRSGVTLGSRLTGSSGTVIVFISITSSAYMAANIGCWTKGLDREKTVTDVVSERNGRRW